MMQDQQGGPARSGRPTDLAGPGAADRGELPERVRLVVLFGGRSAEHDISCVSASHVLAALDRDRYEVVPVGITRGGSFVAAEASDELRATGAHLELLHYLATAGSATPGVPTVVLPILHGPNGEDGTIQGLLEIAGVPYVGSGVLSSAVSMDKAMAKTVLRAEGIPQTAWRTVHSSMPPTDAQLEEIISELGPVLFVKPANMGSSIGVSRHEGPVGDLRAAVDAAMAYDDVVVVEAAVDGRELECAVLGNEEPRASVMGEVVTDAEFYDFDDKYVDGTASTVIPAELDAATMDRGRDLAIRTFETLRCAGMARVDLFLDGSGEFLVNEVNTIPGFTPISMYPKLWEASGLTYAGLIDELVALALEIHLRRSSRPVRPS